MVEVQIFEVDEFPALLNSGLGLFSIVWFQWLPHITYLANVTVEIKVYTLPKEVKLGIHEIK
jgi:hypothetical protein